MAHLAHHSPRRRSALALVKEHAAQTAQVFSSPEALRAIRLQVERERPDLRHDMSGLRKASIAQALRQAGDDENLAIPAFEIFFAERQRVQPVRRCFAGAGVFGSALAGGGGYQWQR